MKTVVLAAGKGERLRSIVKEVPKPMVKINGKPILEHNIELLRSYGIADIYINLHYLPDVIRNYFEDGKKWGVNITYSYEPEILGTAGAVKKFEKYIRHNQFMVFYGDNCYNYNLAEIIKFHNEKKGLGTIGVYEKEDVSQSGIVEMGSNNRVLRFIEKPKPHEVVSHLVNTGIYVFAPEIFRYIPERKFSDFGRDIFPKILKEGKNIYAMILKGKLTAIDTPEIYRQAMEEFA